MARRKAFLHIGLPNSGAEFLDPALAHHGPALATSGVRRPALSADEMFRAAVEIRRDHKMWGYRRREVEGAWSGICRRAHKGKDTVVFSQEHLAGAPTDQIALLLDGLSGFAVHIVITAATPAMWARPDHPELDLAAVLDRWGAAADRPDRVHVIVPSSDDPGASMWKAFGHIVGFDASVLDLAKPVDPGPPLTPSPDRYDQAVELAESWGKAIADGGYDLHGYAVDLVPMRSDDALSASTDDRLSAATEALASALFEVERLRHRTDTLEARNTELQRKRRKLKRRLADVIIR